MNGREIPTSELGTETYWNQFYETEINNFNENGDQGECWFGNSLLRKIIKWVELELKFDKLDKEKSIIIDIGMGNGNFLFELCKLGFKDLRGIDYSSNSVQFSNLILERDFPNFKEKIKFIRFNVLEPINQIKDYQTNWEKKFNLAFDKGTYDAICLNPDQNYQLDQLKEKYKLFLDSILSIDGLFILCSCNWTKDELIKDFIDNNSTLQLSLSDEIKQNSFVFGGSTGNAVTCLIFKRK